MKKISTLRSLLGISQDDMAQLLGVPRSQISMFEGGRRGLPFSAKVLMAELLEQAATPPAKKQTEDPGTSEARQHYLTELLQENELKRFRLGKKLGILRGRYEKNQTIIRLTAYLRQNTKGKPGHFSNLITAIQSKATTAGLQCNEEAIQRCEVQAELLELEQQWLKELLKKNHWSSL